jgi:hypothetical protein
MTIGMLISRAWQEEAELCMACFRDATPFSFHESGDKLAIDYFGEGEQLQNAGYNYLRFRATLFWSFGMSSCKLIFTLEWFCSKITAHGLGQVPSSRNRTC